MSTPQTPEGMARIEKKSAIPIYAFAAVWVIFLVARPLYKLSHILLAAVVAFAAYFILGAIVKPKVYFEKAESGPPQTGDTAADAFLKEGIDYLKKIDALSDQVKNPGVKAKVDALEQLIGQILAQVEQKPKTAAQLSKFVSYYLPTLHKLVSTYVNMESQNIQGENITASLESIDKILDTLTAAFRKQLDALYGDTALDISTDITVLEGMLTQEGLADDTNTLKF